ncbi:PXDN [Mytilus coruscus]|uniref:PXDN n=1 Tax=Mytilus coruscus TaxID=42192 RepID=A0A6J8DIM3_MYTCO|nr:PXDN [Mytilus coruscus]
MRLCCCMFAAGNMRKMSFITIIVSTLILIETATSLKDCRKKAKYRTIDGSCNNLRNPTWGKSDTKLRRLTDKDGYPMVAYEDGISLPRGYPNKLPNPRTLSNLVSDSALGPKNQNDRTRTGEAMCFGQLIAHDVIETAAPSDVDCCNKMDPHFGNIDVCFPFDVPSGDSCFPPSCKNFVRAKAATKNQYSPAYREQVNLITSYIDCSFLYGSTKSIAESVRQPNSFLMKIDPGNLLPTTSGGGCLKDTPKVRCPFAGDSRSVEVPYLSLNHLLFVREHNRLSTRLRKLNWCWSNEKVFQETRRIIIAQVQHIVYNQFLPVVLDKRTMRKFKLFSKKWGYDNVYNDQIDASVFSSFSGAAARYGHSQIMPDVSELKDDYTTVITHKLEDTFLNPYLWQQRYGSKVKDLTRSIPQTQTQKIDNFVVDAIRNKLFSNKNPPGTDLFARNIQRGREKGLPAYNEWRDYCGLGKYEYFYQFGEFGSALASVYKSVDDVDLIVGGLLEKGICGSVGPTFACILGIQYSRFKVGDRFWYESDDPQFAFSKAQLNSIKKATSLSKIWCTNFGIELIQKNIFKRPFKYNRLRRCKTLQDINLSLWKDHDCYGWSYYLHYGKHVQ